jgi:IclR family KDG regulon transcriptional repressor
LRETLQRIREAGYHVAVNDLDEGAFSIAAPIRDAHGKVIAGISVAGAMARFNENTRAQYLEAVQEAAATISAKLSLTRNRE